MNRQRSSEIVVAMVFNGFEIALAQAKRSHIAFDQIGVLNAMTQLNTFLQGLIKLTIPSLWLCRTGQRLVTLVNTKSAMLLALAPI